MTGACLATKAQQNAFTLVELLLTLAIAAALTLLATPVFTHWVRDYRAASAINTLAAAIQHARTSALLHRRTVTFCPGNADGCGAANSWAKGAVLFIDTNANRLRESNETLIGLMPALVQGTDIRWRSFRNRRFLLFTARGITDWQNGHFQYCPPDSDARYARMLVLNAAGRVRHMRDKDGDGIVEDATDRPLACP